MESLLVEGKLSAASKNFAIVCGRFNSLYSEPLLAGALDAIERHGGDKSSTTVVRVPGSFEIPLACKELAQLEKFHAIIALGVLIDGETDHYRLVANELSSGLSKVMLEYSVPVSFGVLTVDTMEKAAARSGSKAGNKGWEATVAAIEMTNVVDGIRSLTSDNNLKALRGR